MGTARVRDAAALKTQKEGQDLLDAGGLLGDHEGEVDGAAHHDLLDGLRHPLHQAAPLSRLALRGCLSLRTPPSTRASTSVGASW